VTQKPLFTRQPSGLSPDNDAAREALQGVPLGAIVACEITRPRNLNHLRLYWALCATIGDSLGVHRENISDVIKLKSGHCRTVKTKTQTYQFPRSISFAKMKTQGEFSAFFNDACRIVCTDFVPHLKPGELRTMIEGMVGIATEQTI
jgi:hypothetical protein